MSQENTSGSSAGTIALKKREGCPPIQSLDFRLEGHIWQHTGRGRAAARSLTPPKLAGLMCSSGP